MTSCFFSRTPAGALAPADAAAAEFISKLKVGKGVRGEFTRARSLPQHRRMFALFNFAFDMWDAPALQFNGQDVQKDFDRFRRDVTILAGFFRTVTTLDALVILEAESLAFHNMSEDRFASVYKAVLGVVWTRILQAKGYDTPEAVDKIVAELLRFE
jgi:hypothetical protein